MDDRPSTSRAAESAEILNRAKTFFGLRGWLVACFAAAALGAFFMPGERDATLKKPSWNPPGWLFGAGRDGSPR